MKRLPLVLSILLCPIAAKAQISVKQMSSQTAQKVIDRYAPIICKKGLAGLIKDVRKCYKKTDIKSADIEICVAGDLILTMATDGRQLPPLILINLLLMNVPLKNVSKKLPTHLISLVGNLHNMRRTKVLL